MRVELAGTELLTTGTVTRANGMIVNFAIRKTNLPPVPGLHYMLWALTGEQAWTLMALGTDAPSMKAIAHGWDGN